MPSHLRFVHRAFQSAPSAAPGSTISKGIDVQRHQTVTGRFCKAYRSTHHDVGESSSAGSCAVAWYLRRGAPRHLDAPVTSTASRAAERRKFEHLLAGSAPPPRCKRRHHRQAQLRTQAGPKGARRRRRHEPPPCRRAGRGRCRWAWLFTVPWVLSVHQQAAVRGLDDDRGPRYGSSRIMVLDPACCSKLRRIGAVGGP